jgi:hypothetical protein
VRQPIHFQIQIFFCLLLLIPSARAIECSQVFSEDPVTKESSLIRREGESFDLTTSKDRNRFLRDFPKLISAGDYIIYRYAGSPFASQGLQYIAYKDADLIELSRSKDQQANYTAAAQTVMNRTTLAIPAEIWKNTVITRLGKRYHLENPTELNEYLNSVMSQPEVGDFLVVWLSPGWQVVRLEKIPDDPTAYIVDDGSGEKKTIPRSSFVAPFIVPQ